MRCVHWPLSAVSICQCCYIIILANGCRNGCRLSGQDWPVIEFGALKNGDNRLHLLARNYPKIGISCGMDDQALEFCMGRALMGVSNLRQKHIALATCG